MRRRSSRPAPRALLLLLCAARAEASAGAAAGGAVGGVAVLGGVGFAIWWFCFRRSPAEAEGDLEKGQPQKPQQQQRHRVSRRASGAKTAVVSPPSDFPSPKEPGVLVQAQAAPVAEGDEMGPMGVGNQSSARSVDSDEEPGIGKTPPQQELESPTAAAQARARLPPVCPVERLRRPSRSWSQSSASSVGSHSGFVIGDAVCLAESAAPTCTALCRHEVGRLESFGGGGRRGFLVRGPRGHLGTYDAADLQKAPPPVAAALASIARAPLPLSPRGGGSPRRSAGVRFALGGAVSRPCDALAAPVGAAVAVKGELIAPSWETGEVVAVRANGAHDVRLDADGRLLTDLRVQTAAAESRVFASPLPEAAEQGEQPADSDKELSPALCSVEFTVTSPSCRPAQLSPTAASAVAGRGLVRPAVPNLGLRAVQGWWVDAHGTKWQAAGGAVRRTNTDGRRAVLPLEALGQDGGVAALRSTRLVAVAPGFALWENGLLWSRCVPRTLAVTPDTGPIGVTWRVQKGMVRADEVAPGGAATREDLRVGDLLALVAEGDVSSPGVAGALYKAALEKKKPFSITYYRPGDWLPLPAEEPCNFSPTEPGGSTEALWGGVWLPCAVLSRAQGDTARPGERFEVRFEGEEEDELQREGSIIFIEAVGVRLAGVMRSPEDGAAVAQGQGLRRRAVGVFRSVLAAAARCPMRRKGSAQLGGSTSLSRRNTSDIPIPEALRPRRLSAEPPEVHADPSRLGLGDPCRTMDSFVVESFSGSGTALHAVQQAGCVARAELLYLLRLTVADARDRLRGLGDRQSRLIDVSDWLRWIGKLAEESRAPEVMLDWIEQRLEPAMDETCSQYSNASFSTAQLDHASFLRPADAAEGGPALPAVEPVIMGPGRAKVTKPDDGGAFKGAVVRAAPDLTSAEVGCLQPGSLCDVVEIVGRRARLAAPLRGWASVTTQEGETILCKPLDPPPLDSCVLVKAPGEGLGMQLADMVLTTVSPGGPAMRGGAQAFIGRRLTHFDEAEVSGQLEVSALWSRPQCRAATLRFEARPGVTVTIRKYHDDPLPLELSDGMAVTAGLNPQLEPLVNARLLRVNGRPVAAPGDAATLARGATEVALCFEVQDAAQAAAAAAAHTPRVHRDRTGSEAAALGDPVQPKIKLPPALTDGSLQSPPRHGFDVLSPGSGGSQRQLMPAQREARGTPGSPQSPYGESPRNTDTEEDGSPPVT
eukprot:TRINITY_DN19762_c0_g1_i1.p1 TRINITY_DN19762_c0_g1~~TRINITY_DN19762_c0_g1_i1.p1  ORF type:complete len:1244 (+),score=325.46 TRINITY_DN19762_c0_g1_i1:76-3732(+)